MSENFENMLWQQTVIGYHNGIAVLTDEQGNFFEMQCEENAAPVGISLPEGIAAEVTDPELIQIYQGMIEEHENK